MITNIYYKPDEIDETDGTVCFYATDGITSVLAGKFPPDQLHKVKAKLMYRELSAAEELCDQNMKEWLSNEMKELGMI